MVLVEDYEDIGWWRVIFIVGLREFIMDIFDGVLICIGYYIYLYFFKFRGLENFMGINMYLYSYRDNKEFEGKRVLVVGKFLL